MICNLSGERGTSGEKFSLKIEKYHKDNNLGA